MQLSKYNHKLEYLYDRKKKSAGRNNSGQITVAHQGGGHKQLYRKVIFKGEFTKGYVTNFEYDPNRSAYLAKICFYKQLKKYYYYILAPQNLKVLDIVESVPLKIENHLVNEQDNFVRTISKQIGSSYYMKDLRVGDYIYNVELKVNKGAQIARAGGTSALILQRSENHTLIKLPSGEHRLIPNLCRAFYGNLSNENHREIIWGKAGKSRWLNKRPTVRGVAKNPIDHPHGGNTSGGCHPVTPWARLTKGKPTRSKNKHNSLIIKSSKSKQK